MAKAKMFTSKTKAIVKSEEGIELFLTMKEARTLANLLKRVGGSPQNTARKYTDSIKECLEKVEIEVPDMEFRNRFLCEYNVCFLPGSDELI